MLSAKDFFQYDHFSFLSILKILLLLLLYENAYCISTYFEHFSFQTIMMTILGCIFYAGVGINVLVQTARFENNAGSNFLDLLSKYVCSTKFFFLLKSNNIILRNVKNY